MNRNSRKDGLEMKIGPIPENKRKTVFDTYSPDAKTPRFIETAEKITGRDLYAEKMEKRRQESELPKRLLPLASKSAKYCQMLYDYAANNDDRPVMKEVIKIATAGARSAATGKSEYYECLKDAYFYQARYDFRSYMIALEWDRKPEEKFYEPRAKQMEPLVRGIQALADDELDELFLSEPPRVGKTTMLLFLCTWLVGRKPDSSNLYSAFSDTITNAFYNGCLEVINDSTTYNWQRIFGDRKLSYTNSVEEALDIDRRKRYHSITARSLYGTLNGACDCNGFLIADDLIGGIEEALSKDRLESAWSKVDNNLIPRAKEGAKLLWCGTRWSIQDPAGRRMALLNDNPAFAGRRIKVINIPAMDENDESNFNYKYGVGFSTDFYRMRRASFEKNNDMASWFAQYMGEPVERSGTVFEPEGMRFYNGTLPEGLPDRIFMAVDPAWGGGDYVAAPVCYQYGDDIYVHDVVYSNADKKYTQPMIAGKIIEHSIQDTEIEANRVTATYKTGVEASLSDKGYKANIRTRTTKMTIDGKAGRIFSSAPDIRDRMLFRDTGCRTKEYSMFMNNVFSFKVEGKNKHDDAPDSLCMAINMAFLRNKVKTVVMDKFF